MADRRRDLRRVTAEWARAFPKFDVWRPMRLLRRIGPVLQGITLDRTRTWDVYHPVAHVHALTREYPDVLLTLGQRMSGSGVALDGDVIAAADQLAAESQLPLHDWPTVGDLVDAWHRRGTTENDLEDAVLTAAAAREERLLAASTHLAWELVPRMPAWRLPLDWPGAAVWLDGLAERSRDVAGLDATIEREVARHGLGAIRRTPRDNPAAGPGG